MNDMFMQSQSRTQRKFNEIDNICVLMFWQATESNMKKKG